MARVLLPMLVFAIFQTARNESTDQLMPAREDVLPQKDGDLLERVFLAIEKLSEFFSSDYSQINVDGLFGLRLGQGQLISALKDLEGTDADLSLIDRLGVLQEQVDYTCAQVLPYVEARDEQYFSRFRPMVEEPYMLPYYPRFLTIPDQRNVTDLGAYDEDAGDICLSKIIGTFVHDGQPVLLCTTDEGCFQMMTSPGTSGYTLTHQLLYFILGDKLKCRKDLQKLVGEEVDVDAIETRMCTEIYLDSAKLAQDGDVAVMDQDLFMEQISLCGVLGFENFMRSDWMKMILRWPNAEGCFTLDLNEEQQHAARELRSIMEQLVEKVDKKRKRESTLSEQKDPTPGSRRLLREFPMKDGCMSHKSGLGFSTLATFLRYLLRATVNLN